MMTLLPRAPWSTTVRPGVERASSVRFSMARRSMSAPVTADMLIGTACSGSSMRVAVTTAASSKALSRRVTGGSVTGSPSTATPSTVASRKPFRKTVTA